MPVVSRFQDIRIAMYYDDLGPSQLHAEYAGCKAIVDIANCCVIKGALPSRELKLVLAWVELHKDELMHNWELALDGEELQQVKPLA
ncbi:MAG: DUF4160 domain-containing protein [Eggerthellaceae bacterium]|nr:DUF4160 domain-containing protein [Eggerthellaceae bacterium]